MITMLEKTDEELIALYRKGDEEAFKMLIERYTPLIFNFIRRLAGAGNATDVVSDVFIKVWKNIERFDVAKAHFKTWIFTIARNTATDFLRKKKSVVFSDLEGDDDAQSFEEGIADATILPDEALEKLEDVASLNKMLDTLPLDYKIVLTLYYQDEMTFEEIGTVLGKPMNTVKSHHRRALIQLRKLATDPSAPKRNI